MYRGLPPLVPQVQESGSADCWLAALISWKYATSGKPFSGDPYKAQGEFLKKLPTVGIDPTTLMLDEKYIKPLLEMEGMVVKEITKPLNLSALGSKFLAKKLEFSYVYVVYRLPSKNIWHAEVIYGVGRPTGKEEQISSMNPSYPRYENHPFSYFDGMTMVVLGWLWV
jgi:hypothetical protein